MKGRKADKVAKPSALVATDLSPFHGLRSEDETWLREVARRADTDTLALSFTSAREVEQAPLAYHDWKSGQWWAGRFVGEVSYQGRTLTILPRFGMPALRRWLSRIWGIRFVTSAGSYAGGRVWLWELVARLWSERLIVAAKHGLPRVRADETHAGPTMRGRLLVRETSARLRTGSQALVSRTRNRLLDPRIGGVLVAAFERLRAELRHAAGDGAWLTDRGRALTSELRAGLDRRDVDDAARSRAPVRYTPITEGYRPAVRLSQSILGGRPFSSSGDGEEQVYGVLLDMAGVWELYLYHLLRDLLAEAEVVHAGRSPEPAHWLLYGRPGEAPLGALKPDIVVSSNGGHRRLILDAKYKLTTPGPDRPQGVRREDLYQMAAYLSVAAAAGGTLNGGLVYPASAAIGSLAERSPFRLARSGAAFAFLGLNCDATEDEAGTTAAERSFGEDVRLLLRGGFGSQSH